MNTHYSAYDKVGAALPVGAGQHDCCDILALQLYRGFLDSLGLDDAALLFCEPRLLKFVNVGGKLGTPTINMRFAEGVLVPRHGVYAAKVFLDNGAEHMAVTNVGVRPTVSGSDRVSVESYILDFEGDLYDHTVRVEFHHFIRDERKFSGVDELKAQILRDAETTREYFAKA